MNGTANTTLATTASGAEVINSFYGPGTWAAWCITLIASWIPMIQGSYKHNLNHIGCVLYTNWAAIDMLRHSAWTVRGGFGHVAIRGRTNASEELGVAACAVVCVGLIHAFMQTVVCIWRMKKEKSKESKVLVQRRFLILLLGSVMPSWIGLHVAIICGNTTELPILGNWTTTFKWALWCLASWVGWNIDDMLPASCYSLPLRLSFMGVTWVAFMLIVFGLPILNSIGPSNTTCYFVPCGAGSLRDWDQAFALFLAGFWFMYEHLPALRRMRWRKERAVARWPGTGRGGRLLPR